MAYKLIGKDFTPVDVVANATVEAVVNDHRHVRYPKRALLFPVLTEAPRRIVELMLTGVKHQT